ncbi:hypothetical protein [uncultured Spirosoma sp.]|uniref:hypothetical protein n=1 Tax=uncultured Spirosoma sp. TaxID=278208 RepID=UPI00258EE48A|nr:hypothetical protein [uncultured Spirosoma sp.]
MHRTSLLYTLASLLLTGSLTMAQDADPTASLRLNNLSSPGGSPLIFRIDNRYEGQHGTPYLIDTWTPGQIALTDGRQYKDVPLKFDAYRQEVLMLRPKQNNDSIIVDKNTVSRFLLAGPDGQSYLFGRYPSAQTTDNLLKNGYFLILYAGKNALLKRIAKTFKPADYKGGYSANVRYDSYSDANSYYLLKPDQTLTKLKLSKKALLEAMSDRADVLGPYADKEKLDLKTEDGITALVKQYDSL